MSKLNDLKWMLSFWVDLGNALQARLHDGSCPGDLPLKPEGALILNRLNQYRIVDARNGGEEPLIDLIRQYPYDAPRFLHPVVVGLLKGEAPAGQDLDIHGHEPGSGVLLMHGGSGWGGIPSVHPAEGETLWRLACGFSHNGGYGSMSLERWTKNDGEITSETVMKFDNGLVFDAQRYGSTSAYVNPHRRPDAMADRYTTWDL